MHYERCVIKTFISRWNFDTIEELQLGGNFIIPEFGNEYYLHGLQDCQEFVQEQQAVGMEKVLCAFVFILGYLCYYMVTAFTVSFIVPFLYM